MQNNNVVNAISENVSNKAMQETDSKDRAKTHSKR